MKILLLTDIPPCKDYTAGIVLDHLCRFVPEGTIVCYCIHHPKIRVQISQDLNIPVEYALKPRENWNILGPVGIIGSLVFENYHERNGLKTLSKKAVRFGRSHNVDRLWCVLQGQTMIRLAATVADDLGVPLLTEVWDPPTWWMRANRVDPGTSSKVIEQYSRAIKKSHACATASMPMAEDYRRGYGTHTIAFLPSLSSDQALPPSDLPHQENTLVFGIAGQLYAKEEWNALLGALDEHSWKIQSRQVRIRHIGDPRPIIRDLTDRNLTDRIELCGWHTQPETISLLSETDITYCPYWFDTRYMDEARLSFPSKLTTYYASGRPVLFHGPPYAAPAKFIEKTHSGICCYSLHHDDIISCIIQVIENPAIYKDLTYHGREAFLKYLTFDNLKQNFMEFIHCADTNKKRQTDRIPNNLHEEFL